MATQALLHEILLALLGHTGQCIQARIAPVAVGGAAGTDATQWEVTGLELASDVPWVTPAERASINALLEAGFAYVRIMHFAQSIDGGATVGVAPGVTEAAGSAHATTAGGSVAAAAQAASVAAAALHTKLASSAAEQRALEAQQARHVYAAAGALLSPARAPRPERSPQSQQQRQREDDPNESGESSSLPPLRLFDPSTALVPAAASAAAAAAAVAASRPSMHHPLVDAGPTERAQPKAVGLYLRALGLGLEEVLAGYRSLILKIEQEILAESAGDPASAPQSQSAQSEQHDDRQVPEGQQQQQQQQAQHGEPCHTRRRIEFGIAKLSLMLRQYLVILPALQHLLAAIVAPPAAVPAATSAAATPSSSSSLSSRRTHSIHGLRLLSFLAEHASTGVPVLRRVFEGLLRHLDRVLVHQLTNWVFYGAVLDPFGEFFVREAPELAAPATATHAHGHTAGVGAGAGAGAGVGAGAAAAQRLLRSFSARGFGTPLGGGGSLAGVSSGGGAAAAVSQLDWDSSYTLAPAQLPHAYLPLMGGMPTAHRILFLGKAVLVLQQGEAEREAREARARARARAAARRRGAGAGASSGVFSPFGIGTPAGGGDRSASHLRTASAAFGGGGFGGGGGWPGSKTPRESRSYANSAAPTPRFVSPSKDSTSASAVGAGSGAGFFRTGSSFPGGGGVPPAAAVPPSTPSVPLLVECQPLLAQFHSLRSQNECLVSGDSLPRLEGLVERLSGVVSRRMYALLMGDCALVAHLRHLKSFALLASGEFATAFVEQAGGSAVAGSASGLGTGSGAVAGGGGVLSRPAGPRSERELNGPNGPLKSALAYAGLRMDLEEEDEEEEEAEEEAYRQAEWARNEMGVGGGGGGVSGRVSTAVANYPARHLVLHLDAPVVPAVPPSLANAVASSAAAASAAAAAARASASASLNPWSCLRLSYPLRAPLDLVVTIECMHKYNALFRFLLHAKRVHMSLQHLWTPLMATRPHHTPGVAGGARDSMGPMLLRQSMSHVLDTLRSYFHLDVVEACWADLVRKLTAARDFDALRAAHDTYLAEITAHCFLKDRIVSSALTDVLDTCLLFCRSQGAAATGAGAGVGSSGAAAPPALDRLASDYARQLCFLFSLLSRKTDFTGGRASLLHALVSRLDFNGHITRLSATLGLDRRSQHQGQGRGAPTSGAVGAATGLQAQGYGRSVAPADGYGSGSSVSTRPSVRSSSTTRSSRDSASSVAPSPSAGSFAFAPAHLSSTHSASGSHAADPQAHLFSHATTRPPPRVPSPREF